MLAKDIVSICKVRVLLVPVSPIKKSTFDRYVQVLQSQCQSVSLADVTPNFKAKFNTQVFQEGQIHFQFQTEWTHEEAHLQDFQPYRRLFGVIGIMDCQEWDDLSIGYQQFKKSLSKYPTAIATRCFAFDPIETQEDDTKGLIMIPNVGNISFYMTTMICDFARDILEQLENLAYRLESLTLLESPTSHDLFTQSTQQQQSHHHHHHPHNHHRFSYPSASTAPTSPTATKRHSLNLIQQNTSSNNLPSPLSSPTPTTTMRIRRRTPGRIQKLLGDLYLLAGLLPDAIKCYNTAIEMARSTSDHLWLASALEGWTCILILLEYLQADMSIILASENNITEIDPYLNGEAPEPVIYLGPWSILTIVSEKYEKILPYYYQESPFLYSEACLRISRFLVTIYINRGCHDITFDLLVQGKFKSKKRLSKFFMIDEKKNNFGLTKLKVSEWMMRIWQVNEEMETLEKIHFRIHMASLYSLLGYQRKCAWLLNEALQYILSLVLKGENQFDKQSITSILKKVCQVYGIKEPTDSEQALLSIRENTSTVVGWPSLQIEILKKCISVTELLHDDRSRFYYTSVLLRQMHPFIPRAEKIRLATIIQGMIINSKYKKSNLLRYWGHNMLLSIQCDAASFIQQSSTIKKDDPFIYSPFSEKDASKNKKLEATISKNEPCEFKVTLVNPFGSELDIQHIQLCTTGVPMKPEEVSPIAIAANDTMTVTISGTPIQTGKLVVRGCLIQIAGFEQHEFLLENLNQQTEGEEEERDHFVKFKKSGLNAIKYDYDANKNKNKKNGFLHFNIIDSQPIAEIKGTSHTQNAVSLFEGETTLFKIELENTGHTQINFINIHFDQDEPKNHESQHLLSHEDQFELKHFNNVSVFSPDSSFKTSKGLDPNKHMDLQPGQRTTINVNVFGKRRGDRQQGTIRIGYGHFQPTSNHHHILHYLYVDVILSIYPLLDIFNWDMLLLPPLEPQKESAKKRENIMVHYSQSHNPNPPVEDMISLFYPKGTYCWIAMDLKNIWMHPFDVFISSKNNTDILFRGTISPLSTSRILFPLKRIFLSEKEWKQPIPIENNIQLSDSRLKLFWYRQSFINEIEATYQCGSHSGTIDMRRYIRSIDHFKLDDVEFKTTMSNAMKTIDETFHCKVESEVVLRLEIDNRLGYMIKSILRMKVPEQVLFSGNQQLILPEFSETFKVRDIPLYFLSKGKYVIRYHLEDIYSRNVYQNRIIVHVT